MNNPIDWKAFEYKFSGDPRAAFESLAYILFCYEFKQTYGIFRYYNQPYIETQPANTADGHKVGFQAKYYDAGTQMSSKEQDLKDAIKGAKNKYVGIDRIIFYINREFSASSAKDKDKPEHQIRIEKYGKNLGIEIQWRGQSHIEKMLAMEELRYVKNLYFNVETGIDHFHESLINHKNSILKHIHSTIKYDEKDIKIAQDYQKLMDFQESDSQVLIIHGAAGAGKSATVKDFLLKKDKKTEDEITVVFSAADLDVKEENLFLKEENYGLQDLFGLYKNEKYRLCVIDSAEKYATARYPEVFGDILQQFLDHGWKVIITIRTFYKDSLCNLFLKNYVQSEQEILKLEKDTLTEMSDMDVHGEFDSIEELQKTGDPYDSFALQKACLLACGIIPSEGGKLDEILTRLGGGFEMHSEVTNVPKGSGLGTSSILSAACVKAVFEFMGIAYTEADLYAHVLVMEQIMSTGGGWQDQVGGVTNGIKYITSKPGLDQQIKVEHIELQPETKRELNERFCLIYTGQRRLARNLLRDVVGRYVGNEPDSLFALNEIQKVAALMRFELERGNIDEFAALLDYHWELSRKVDAGSTNTLIDQIFLSIEDLIDARMVCGAGGGGFLQVILKKGITKEDVHKRLKDVFQDNPVDVWDCEII